ncbi:MAG: histone deacetylase, partial [Gemmatimonadota bacterium]
MALHVWSSAHYVIPLPEGHRFPIAKYALLREAVLTAGIASPATLHAPARLDHPAATRTHDPVYLERLVAGTMPAAE